MSSQSQKLFVLDHTFAQPIAIGDQLFRLSPFEFDQTKKAGEGVVQVAPSTIVLKSAKVSQTILVPATITAR